jgi:hypothetical protein
MLECSTDEMFLGRHLFISRDTTELMPIAANTSNLDFTCDTLEQGT